MTPQLISKDRVLEIIEEYFYGGMQPSMNQYKAFAAALEAELLERLGQGFEEAVRLSGLPQDVADMWPEFHHFHQAGAARRDPEIQALREELAEEEAIRERCAQLLAKTAVALKGEEAPLQRHGWQDLPEAAQALREEVERLKGKLAAYALVQAMEKMSRDRFIREAVDAFLSWKLPDDFHPDCGIAFTPLGKPHPEAMWEPWPVGTNLFTTEQARQMFEHCIQERKVIMPQVEKQLLAAQLSERKLREALIMIYDKWENGQDCYEDVEELAGYSGKAVNLSEEEENQILSLIPSVLNGNTSPTNTDEADKLIKSLEVAKDALQKLSCLGNGERPGNSVGNSIAQEAITTINELGITA